MPPVSLPAQGRGEVGSGGVASCSSLLHGNCSCSLTFAKGTQWYEQTKEELMAPTLLPELHLLKQVCGMGPRELCPGVNSSRAALHSRQWSKGLHFLSVCRRLGSIPRRSCQGDAWGGVSLRHDSCAPLSGSGSSACQDLFPAQCSSYEKHRFRFVRAALFQHWVGPVFICLGRSELKARGTGSCSSI